MAREHHVKCCGCQRVKTEHGWEETHRVPGLDVTEDSFSHGYCPGCYQKALVAFKMRAPQAALRAAG
jgi:hypothetical protein